MRRQAVEWALKRDGDTHDTIACKCNQLTVFTLPSMPCAVAEALVQVLKIMAPYIYI